MNDGTERDRHLSAYAAETRAFHRFFALTLLGLAALHLLVIAPYLRLRAAIPVIDSKIDAVRAQIKSGDDAQRAVDSATASLNSFRQTLTAGPDRLRKAIADFIARGRAIVGPTSDPFRAGIKVPKEGGQPGQEETITVDEAIRRQIGKEIESQTISFDQTVESARAIKDLPADADTAFREARGAVGRDIVSLNEILRQAFDADPYFWKRWERPGATFGAASPKADDAMRRIDLGLRGLQKTLTNASAQAKAQQQEVAPSIDTLRAGETAIEERLTRTGEVLGRLPIGMDEAARVYPLAALALALTALIRLRRLLILRQMIGVAAADAAAPSWVIVSRSSPGRWLSLALLAAPLLAAAHAAAAAVRDPGLFTTALGDQSQGLYVGSVAGYVALGIVTLFELTMATRAMLADGPAVTPGG